jgi:hypothetical protein
MIVETGVPEGKTPQTFCFMGASLFESAHKKKNIATIVSPFHQEMDVIRHAAP